MSLADSTAAEVWREAVPDLTDAEVAALQHLLRTEPHHLRRMAAAYRAVQPAAAAVPVHRAEEAANILREVVADIDNGTALGPATSGTLTAIAAALVPTRPPLVEAGPDPDMDAAWCQDLTEYMRLADRQAHTDSAEAGGLSDVLADQLTDQAFAVVGGLAERARAGQIPGVTG